MDIETLGAWKALLRQELSAPYFENLKARVDAARAETQVYPLAGRELFALENTQPQAVRVVFLGRDPYREPGQALVRGTLFPGLDLPFKNMGKMGNYTGTPRG